MLQPHLAQHIQNDLTLLTNSGAANSADVTIHWQETTTPPDYDPNNQSGPQPSVSDKNETIKALVHFVNIDRTGYQKWTEFQSGDVIIDFLHDVNLDNRHNIHFTFNGKTYFQKNVGRELAESMDAIIGGKPITKTLLLTLKQ